MLTVGRVDADAVVSQPSRSATLRDGRLCAATHAMNGTSGSSDDAAE